MVPGYHVEQNTQRGYHMTTWSLIFKPSSPSAGQQQHGHYPSPEVGYPPYHTPGYDLGPSYPGQHGARHYPHMYPAGSPATAPYSILSAVGREIILPPSTFVI